MSNTRTVRYRDRGESMICVKRLRKPYGSAPGDVVSVGCTLKNDPENPTWKVHVPTELVREVCTHMLELAEKEEELPPVDLVDGEPLYHEFLL